jgi:hypothetical protein
VPRRRAARVPFASASPLVASLLTCCFAAGLAGCGAGRFTPPTVAPVPFDRPEAAWAEATRVCAGMNTYRGELKVSGPILGPSVTLALALEADGKVALDARVGATSTLTLRGTDASATLVLPDRGRYVTGPPRDILDALIGTPVGATRLFAVLTGCLSVDRTVKAAESLNEVGRFTTADATAFLTRRQNQWRVRAGSFDGVWIDYQEYGADAPRRLTIRTVREGRETTLALSVEAYDTVRVPPSQFVPNVPSSASPLTIEELRRDGPFVRR